MTIKILTVRQPWAWAIIHGGKDVENRSRNIAGDYRGTVAIHAGLTTDLDAMSRDMVGRIATTRLFRPEREWFSNSPNGAIIGVVDLVDVHHSDNCPGRTVVEDVGTNLVKGYHDSLCSPWAMYRNWHLILANPRPLPEPIPHKGALGLRTLPAEVEALIWAQIGEGLR